MTQELAIALVAGAAGLIGALVGGAASLATSYFGPKWERERTETAEFRERRRVAIIEWIDAAQKAATAAIQKTDDRPERSAAFNLALSQLTSLLGPDETPVDNFIHGAGSYAGSFKHNRAARGLIIAQAGRFLVAWHRGSVPVSALRPFRLVHSDGPNGSGLVSTPSWSTAVEGEVKDTAVSTNETDEAPVSSC